MLIQKLKNMIKNSFMTCNSDGRDGYNVILEFKTLEEAHEFHRAMIDFRRCHLEIIG
jgi:hypothetical protein